MRLSHDLLMRGIAYKLQERPRGGLSKSILRKLRRLNPGAEASGARKPAPPIPLKAGTRLVREWRGVTRAVLVHDNGFEWTRAAAKEIFQEINRPIELRLLSFLVRGCLDSASVATISP